MDQIKEHQQLDLFKNFLHPKEHMNRKIMIVTGEASGDLHGANLVRSLLDKDPTLQFCGMGGAELAALGVEILYDAAKVSVVGDF